MKQANLDEIAGAWARTSLVLARLPAILAKQAVCVGDIIQGSVSPEECRRRFAEASAEYEDVLRQVRDIRNSLEDPPEFRDLLHRSRPI